MKLHSLTMLPLLLALSADQARPLPESQQQIDTIFADITASHSAGCAISAQQGPMVLHEAAYGMADIQLGVPLTANHIFHAGSIAKQLTATIILQLEAEGKLSLRHSVRQYLPELSSAYSPATLQHLLEHTSGIRDDNELLWMAGGRDDDEIDRESVIELLRRQQELNFAPGERFLYSNAGYFLLGLVAEKVGGAPLDALAAQRLFEPLGMAHTRFRTFATELIPFAATGHRQASRPGTWRLAPYVSNAFGAGGLFTTVGDLQKWQRHLLDNTQLLASLTQQGTTSTGTTGWGRGLALTSLRSARAVGHGGRDLGWQSYAMVFPDHNLSFAVLCNGRDIDAEDLARRAAQLFLPATVDQPVITPARPRETVAPARELAAYAGTYWNPATLAIRRVEARGDALVWARGAGTILVSAGNDRFRFPEQPIEVLFERTGTSAGLDRLSVTTEGRPASRYVRVEPFVVPPGGLAGYEGDYYSDELSTYYRVRAVADPAVPTVSVSTGLDFTLPVRAVFRDAFSIGEGVLVQFHRDAQGRVSSLRISTDRARNVLFKRQ